MTIAFVLIFISHVCLSRAITYCSYLRSQLAFVSPVSSSSSYREACKSFICESVSLKLSQASSRAKTSFPIAFRSYLACICWRLKFYKNKPNTYFDENLRAPIYHPTVLWSRTLAIFWSSPVTRFLVSFQTSLSWQLCRLQDFWCLPSPPEKKNPFGGPLRQASHNQKVSLDESSLVMGFWNTDLIKSANKLEWNHASNQHIYKMGLKGQNKLTSASFLFIRFNFFRWMMIILEEKFMLFLVWIKWIGFGCAIHARICLYWEGYSSFFFWQTASSVLLSVYHSTFVWEWIDCSLYHCHLAFEDICKPFLTSLALHEKEKKIGSGWGKKQAKAKLGVWIWGCLLFDLKNMITKSKNKTKKTGKRFKVSTNSNQ